MAGSVELGPVDAVVVDQRPDGALVDVVHAAGAVARDGLEQGVAAIAHAGNHVARAVDVPTFWRVLEQRLDGFSVAFLDRVPEVVREIKVGLGEPLAGAKFPARQDGRVGSGLDEFIRPVVVAVQGRAPEFVGHPAAQVVRGRPVCRVARLRRLVVCDLEGALAVVVELGHVDAGLVDQLMHDVRIAIHHGAMERRSSPSTERSAEIQVGGMIPDQVFDGLGVVVRDCVSQLLLGSLHGRERDYSYSAFFAFGCSFNCFQEGTFFVRHLLGRLVRAVRARHRPVHV